MKPDQPKNRKQLLSIGTMAERSGLAPSALRFYESKGLIQSIRTASNQRRYRRSELRKISVIKVAQNLGLSLEEIDQALSSLPDKRVPTKKDWEKLSRSWRRQLDERIEHLTALRDSLSGCIGCGCLSLQVCSLYNDQDRAGQNGEGARYLLGESPKQGDLK